MSQELIGPVAVALGTIFGAYASLAKIKAGFKKELQEETQKAIVAAREASISDIAILQVKIENLGKDMTNLKDSIEKEIDFVKQTHDSEIRNLGSKIEELRDEVRGQHSQLVSLLSKLISDR